MKNWILPLIMSCLLVTGCRGNLSPSPISNPENNGKIDSLETNQNAIKLELAKISQDIGKIRDMQQGILNLQANNSGIQILQGSGPMFLIFGLATIAMLLYYFYQSKQNDKMIQVLSQQIKMFNNEELNEKIMLAAMNTEIEKKVFKFLR